MLYQEQCYLLPYSSNINTESVMLTQLNNIGILNYYTTGICVFSWAPEYSNRKDVRQNQNL